MKIKETAKQGYALVTIMGIMFVLAITFAMISQSGSQSAFTGARLKEKAKATCYAEAGVEFAYSVLRDNYDNRLNPGLFRIDTSSAYNGGDLVSSYDEGTFTLTITPSSNGQYVVVNSVGTCRRAEVEVEVLVEDTAFANAAPPVVIPNYDDYDVFNKAMATEGSATFTGGGDLFANDTTLKIHSNEELTIRGNIDVPCSITSSAGLTIRKCTIDGSAQAPTISAHNKAVISGGSTEAAVPTVVIPTVDMEPFRLHAEENGGYISGDATLSSDPPGGVWYVNGNVTIPPGATINGTIIAAGDIDVKGDVNETHGIAVGTLSGDITYNSQATSVGMVYTQSGTFSQTGGGSSGVITGQIIAGAGAFKAGGGDLVFGKYLPITPEDGITNPDSVTAAPQIAAWQK